MGRASIPKTKPKPAGDLRFEPATPERWRDIEALFGERGACGGCWCMAWRKPRALFVRDKGDANRDSLRKLVQSGPPPGVLAYDGDRPAGWCAVAPRQEYVSLANSRVLKPIDDAPVWSVSCFFIAKPYRRQGVSVKLIAAAIDFVRDRGGRIVEAYPVAPKEKTFPDTFAWTGTLAAFISAGFHEMPRWSGNRPIVRYIVTE